MPDGRSITNTGATDGRGAAGSMVAGFGGAGVGPECVPQEWTAASQQQQQRRDDGSGGLGRDGDEFVSGASAARQKEVEATVSDLFRLGA